MYDGQTTPLRHMTFAGLRPYLKPPLTNENLGCYIGMSRCTLLAEAGQVFWTLARELHDKIYRSAKQGEKFIASVMSKGMMKMLFKMKSARMGTTALSYMGVNRLDDSYGAVKPIGLHTYVSNFTLGPELTALTVIFSGELCWDILYLDADMAPIKAREIAEEIRIILEKSI